MNAFRGDTAAVSDIMGGLLMVGITVTLLAGLAFLLLSIEGPQEEDRPSLTLSADGGTFGWGTGDEGFTIRHHGGEPLDRDGVTVNYYLDGTQVSLTGAQLDGDWADGELSIGESWTYAMLIDDSDDLRVEIVQNTYDSHIVAAGRVRVGEIVDCSSDTAAPDVSTWIQAPSDIEPDTIGDATIEVVVTDACSGVDEAIAPHLEYRLDGGSWIDTGAMTDVGIQRWEGTITDPPWSDHDGDTLEYKVTGMTDNLGNSGDSAVQSDALGVTEAWTYVASYSETTGTVDDFSDMQAADDSDAEATLTQASGATVHTVYALDGDDGSGATSETNILGAPDDQWAILNDEDENVIADDYDVTGLSGSITKVEVVFEAHRVDSDGDRLDIDVREATGPWQEEYSNWYPQTGTDEELVIDITDRDGSWTWSEINALDVRVDYDDDEEDVDFYVDAVYLRVTADGGPAVDIQFDWGALPGGSLGELQLRYQVTADTYHVEVYDGSSWNTRGATLDQGSWTDWTYTLTGAEQTACTGPCIRIIDDTPTSTAGTIEFDYARVQDT